MGRSASDIQRQLDWLSPSANEYRPLLLELLSHHDLKLHIRGLHGDDLRRFVELLDKVDKATVGVHQH
jgi:hypothetical protein